MIPIYYARRVPGAPSSTEWTTFCHSKSPFITIDYETTRPTSRWKSVDRTRKFAVIYHTAKRKFAMCSYYSTLEAAQKAAAKLAKDMAEFVK